MDWKFKFKNGSSGISIDKHNLSFKRYTRFKCFEFLTNDKNINHQKKHLHLYERYWKYVEIQKSLLWKYLNLGNFFYMYVKAIISG